MPHLSDAFSLTAGPGPDRGRGRQEYNVKDYSYL
jgi:hypothetical protein